MNVKLIENKVKSHAGIVYVTQYKTVGSTPRIESITRPSKPNVVEEAVSVAISAAIEVTTAFAALETTAADLSAREWMASGAAMSAMLERVTGRDGRLSRVFHLTNFRYADVETGLPLQCVPRARCGICRHGRHDAGLWRQTCDRWVGGGHYV